MTEPLDRGNTGGAGPDHLHANGFTSVPRPLGIDDEGREVLTDETLDQVARRLREYHDVVAGFVPPPDAVWRGGLPVEPGSVIAHNDAGPYNAAWQDGRPRRLHRFLDEYSWTGDPTALLDLVDARLHAHIDDIRALAATDPVFQRLVDRGVVDELNRARAGLVRSVLS